MAGAVVGAGELAGTLGGAELISTSPPDLTLFSLSTLLEFSFVPPSLFSLLLPPLPFSAEAPEAEESCASPLMVTLGGAFQRGISQTVPVKVLIEKPPFAHFLHGLPVRSRARRPALMAPWLALGPSLWAPAALMGAGLLVPETESGSPSSLNRISK
jgi:hypothetical protein